MFGLPEALMSFIRRQVGLRTDAASSTGSLHAKVAELRNYIYSQIATVKKPEGTLPPVNFSTSETSYQTALDVTGSGTLIALAAGTGSSGYATIKITIDGSTIIEGRTVGASTWAIPKIMVNGSPEIVSGKTVLYHDSTSDIFLAPTDVGYDQVNPYLRLPYKSSLKIEIKVSAGTHSVKAIYSKV